LTKEIFYFALISFVAYLNLETKVNLFC